MNLDLFYTAWMLAYIKRNILQVDIPEPPKGVISYCSCASIHLIMFSGNFLHFTSVSEESVPVETSATEKSRHEMPEIAIGTIFTSLKFHKVLILITFSEI